MAKDKKKSKEGKEAKKARVAQKQEKKATQKEVVAVLRYTLGIRMYFSNPGCIIIPLFIK